MEPIVDLNLNLNATEAGHAGGGVVVRARSLASTPKVGFKFRFGSTTRSMMMTRCGGC
jgi:hypothetical protein